MIRIGKEAKFRPFADALPPNNISLSSSFLGFFLFLWRNPIICYQWINLSNYSQGSVDTFLMKWSVFQVCFSVIAKYLQNLLYENCSAMAKP